MRTLTLAATLAVALVVTATADERRPMYVGSAAATLIDQGLAKPAPASAEAAAFEHVPAPVLRFRVDDARSTRAPWLDSNAWRFQRGLTKARYAALPAGSAALAAAEAYIFNVEAILEPDAKDVEPLGRMLTFLKAHDRAPMAARSNIDVVDDRSPAMGEILNLLTRRNLLYRVVAKPEPRANALTVQVGSADFPKDAAVNPSDFAALVRSKLGDDKRLVRLYGPNAAIAHLTGDDARLRLFILSFTANTDRGMQGGDAQGVRVRLLGRYQPTAFAAYGSSADAALTDVTHPGNNSTEFWVPAFQTIAIVDLDAMR